MINYVSNSQIYHIERYIFYINNNTTIRNNIIFLINNFGDRERVGIRKDQSWVNTNNWQYRTLHNTLQRLGHGELCAGAVITTISFSDYFWAGQTPGSLPLSSFPLHHSDHHPPSPVTPDHILNLVIRKTENNTDNQTLQISTVSKTWKCDDIEG